MKTRLSRRRRRRYANADELWVALKGEWDQLREDNHLREDNNLVNSLFESLPRRLQAVIDSSGASTRYYDILHVLLS